MSDKTWFLIEDEVEIECTGIDRKRHVCKPHESVTKCGVKILRKKVGQLDRAELDACYECTF